MEFINQKVFHKHYGEGTILDYTPKPIELDSRFTIYFKEKGEKQFAFKQMPSFFTLPDSLLEIHGNLETFKKSNDTAKIKAVAKGIAANKAAKSTVLHLEPDDSITVEDIVKIIPVLNDYRFVFEHRPVVVDKKKCYLNALYALNANQMDLTLSELVYHACSKNKNKGAEFCGHHFKFATRDELEFILEELQKDDTK